MLGVITMATKSIEYYMQLPYAMEICEIPKEEGGSSGITEKGPQGWRNIYLNSNAQGMYE